jgi:hypothetical protein
MSSQQTHRLGLCTRFVTGCLRLTLQNTITQHRNSSCSLNMKDTVSPQKGVTQMSLLGVDQSPLLSPDEGLNLNLSTYQSGEWDSQVDSWAFLRSFMKLDLASSDCQERDFLPSDQHNPVECSVPWAAVLADQGHWARWQGQILDKPPEML